ncbi:hypothetical protein NPIL_245521, partial [Nephila pilipes]
KHLSGGRKEKAGFLGMVPVAWSDLAGRRFGIVSPDRPSDSESNRREGFRIIVSSGPGLKIRDASSRQYNETIINPQSSIIPRISP